MKQQSSKSETKNADNATLKSKIEKILSEILSDKHDAKIDIKFVANKQ